MNGMDARSAHDELLAAILRGEIGGPRARAALESLQEQENRKARLILGIAGLAGLAFVAFMAWYGLTCLGR